MRRRRDWLGTSLGIVVVGSLVVAVSTGVWLTENYHPIDTFVGVGVAERMRQEDIQLVHRLSTFVLLATGLIVAGRRMIGPTSSGWGIVVAVTTALTALAALPTGAALAWEQLVVTRVVDNERLRGARVAFDDDLVRSVIVDQLPVAPSTYMTSYAVHLAVAALLVLGWLVTWRTRGGSADRVPSDAELESTGALPELAGTPTSSAKTDPAWNRPDQPPWFEPDD